MTHATRRLLFTTLALAAIVVACGPAQGSPSPSSVPTASAAPSLSSSPTALPSVSTAPTTAPSGPPSASPSASSSAAACGALPSDGQLPSDRFVDLKVSSGADADRLTFVFGNNSLPGPAGPPQGSLDVAVPPFTEAASGATIDLVGDHALQVRFDGMALSNDVGQETYKGPPEFKPDFQALRHAVLFDASEGVIGWYVGYDGAGCVTLTREGDNIVVTIAHG